MEFVPSGEKKFLLAHCHVKEEHLTDDLLSKLPKDSVFVTKALSKVVLMEPPAPHGNGTNCICNSGTAPAVVALLFCFSVCVQAAEGLSFGIVPYISRPALGVVSGMVGAGGNGGAVAMLNLFFKGPRELSLPHSDTFGMCYCRSKLPETLCRAPDKWQKLLPPTWLLTSEFGVDFSGYM